MAAHPTTAQAIDHSLKRWAALIRYVKTCAFIIDYNPIENRVRPMVLGNTNRLFSGSEWAGSRADGMHFLLGTTELNSLNPAAWLKDTLEKLSTWFNRHVDEQLPLHFAD